MADLEVPEPPPEVVALRAMLDRLLLQFAGVAVYRHEDTPHETDSHRALVHGWGTDVFPVRAGRPFTVWFDGLDRDIAVWTDRAGWRRSDDDSWWEWPDLSDMTAVLASLEKRLRGLLTSFG